MPTRTCLNFRGMSRLVTTASMTQNEESWIKEIDSCLTQFAPGRRCSLPRAARKKVDFHKRSKEAEGEGGGGAGVGGDYQGALRGGPAGRETLVCVLIMPPTSQWKGRNQLCLDGDGNRLSLGIFCAGHLSREGADTCKATTADPPMQVYGPNRLSRGCSARGTWSPIPKEKIVTKIVTKIITKIVTKIITKIVTKIVLRCFKHTMKSKIF